jgi:hypothetical protein
VDTGYLGRVLDILIGIAAVIAETVLQQAKSGPVPVVLDGAAVYIRVCRAVRRMIMLAMAIDAPDYTEAPQRRADRNAQVRERKDPAAREAKEHPERPDRLDIRYTLKNKTMDQLIGEICRDLGLPKLDGSYHWESLTPEEIASLVANAAVVLLKQAAAKREAEAARSGYGRGWAAPSGLGHRAEAPPGSEARVPDG